MLMPLRADRSLLFILLSLTLLLKPVQAFLSCHTSMTTKVPTSSLVRSRALGMSATLVELDNQTTTTTTSFAPTWPADTFSDASSSSSLSSLPNLGLDAPVHNFATLLDCLEFLDNIPETHDESLVVVKYYASYCRICKRASISYKKIAMDESYAADFHFTRVEAGRLSGERLKTLGLTKFPFVQIFRKGMCVGECIVCCCYCGRDG